MRSPSIRPIIRIRVYRVGTRLWMAAIQRDSVTPICEPGATSALAVERAILAYREYRKPVRIVSGWR